MFIFGYSQLTKAILVLSGRPNNVENLSKSDYRQPLINLSVKEAL